MENIITINRQFGSGGREIGKRLADALHWKHFDKELLTELVKNTGFAQQYLEEYDEKVSPCTYPLTYGMTLHMPYFVPDNTLYIEQSHIIQQIGETGNAVIVGRCAPYLLRDKSFKVFVYSSDMNQRIDRCYAKNPADQDKTRKEMEKMIRDVDKQRAKYCNFYTGVDWMDMTSYNLCIDTAVIPIKKAVELIVDLYQSETEKEKRR